MNHLAVIYALVLASTNASKYLQPIQRIQQEPKKQISDDGTDASDAFPDDSFGISPPKLNSGFNNVGEWTLDAEPPYNIFGRLQGNTLDDLRMKRTDASLSIVNALDVLRQKIMLEFARRKMNESKAQIQRNRELLMKTGKRSEKSYEEPHNYRLREFLKKRMTMDNLEMQDVSSKGNEQDLMRPNGSELAFQA